MPNGAMCGVALVSSGCHACISGVKRRAWRWKGVGEVVAAGKSVYVRGDERRGEGKAGGGREGGRKTLWREGGKEGGRRL